MFKLAVILAGGKGTRLKPYTISLPKPLVPIGEMPIIEIIIRQLVNNGFEHITVTINHMADIIKAFCGNGEKWNVKIDYSLEDKPLSTMGPLKLIKDLPENFLVMNGDILCDLNYKDFFIQHINSNALISVSTFKREVKVDFGVLRYGADKLLTEFQEKPKYDFDVSMGIYCLAKRVVEKLPRGCVYGFDTLMLDGIRNRDNIKISPFDGYWLDIGRPDDYEYADQNFDQLVEKLGI